MAAAKIPTSLTGVVISAGRMMRAVKVITYKQKYNTFLRKHFTIPQPYLVSDPTSALRTGDVIRLVPETHSKLIRHVVAEIVAPFGVPIDERPAVLTEVEREARRTEKRERKLERREERRRDGGVKIEGGGEAEEVEGGRKEPGSSG